MPQNSLDSKAPRSFPLMGSRTNGQGIEKVTDHQPFFHGRAPPIT